MTKNKLTNIGFPKKQGLYDSNKEHDSCGVGLIADINNEASHDIVKKGLAMLCNLEHRGAVGADPKAGDGSGILIQIPHNFLVKEVKNINLPEKNNYGVGVFFIKKDNRVKEAIFKLIEEICEKEKVPFLGWRECPTYGDELGWSVKPTIPLVYHLFVGKPENIYHQDDWERKIYVLRQCIDKAVAQMGDQYYDQFYIPSFSSRTILYKGMVLSDQVGTVGNQLGFFEDLSDPMIESSFALIHQRFSTNTFPTWSLAQPFRMLCHNGEINTVRGNINWMNARHSILKSDKFSTDIDKIWPIIKEGQSDSASFDNALELLVHGGYSIAEAMLIMIPEAWQNNHLLDEKLKSFYEYHAPLMEPWDGPANIAFTDGKQIGALLDRNGLRPARYLLTNDNKLIFASEMGLLPVDEKSIISKWRLQPGKMLLLDLDKKAIISDEEIKKEISEKNDWKKLLHLSQINIENIPETKTSKRIKNTLPQLKLMQAFGYTQEDENFLMNPMAHTAMEAIGSMGTDTPVSALSRKSKLLYTYFKQNFAQVTNPPIDPIREEIVMSLFNYLGERGNILDIETKDPSTCIKVKQPILKEKDINKIINFSKKNPKTFKIDEIEILFNKEEEKENIRSKIEEICIASEQSVISGSNIIILTDINVSEKNIALPALLVTSAVHHHLIRKGLRTSVGLIIETAEAREIHHFCCLAGYGADAISPWLALRRASELAKDLGEEAQDNFIKASGKGMLKVMSKMGISTYQSYCGAQIFDAIGLSSSLIDEYFTGTSSKIEGIDVDEIERETSNRHNKAFENLPALDNMLEVGGEYALRLRGEEHVWNSNTVRDLQHAVRSDSFSTYENYAKQINDQDKKLMTLRGLFKFKNPESYGRKKIDIDQVESAKEIVKRFATGAMSYGSISREAHTNLAIAMNRIGGKSNTGEGGEEVDRYKPMDNGDSMRSAIKQVASGRFGVTAEYLSNSDMIQIKMAQGAKPGEGGQLPGHKVDETIAKVRYSTPGVGLISPPPHHDIYSIEDLAQLIYDLKNANPEAAISVKLVSEVGVGTVAAGVSKAKADHLTISGFEGGTGASPLTSIKHAGSPWEIGLAETHQTLVLNGLRSRIAVQVDGGLRTGRDVVVGALLGADEFGFSTAPLIASGCIMMRKCHLNTCPVGIATQDKELRKLFNGQPEHVVNYFFFVAEEVRKLMAELGFKNFNEMVGETDVLDTYDAIDHWKAEGLNFEKLFYKPESWEGEDSFNSRNQEHDIYDILDRKLIDKSQAAIENKLPIKINTKINNTDRSTGTMLSHMVVKKYGHSGLPDDTINIQLKGTAGQSFGAFLAKGITLDLEGEGNDYVAKGISGGRITIRPPKESIITPHKSMIVGNTVLYGAIEGECYFRGVAGERFAVRNSGATAVVEGAGDHCCEYMTGGIVVVLGKVGRNFGAGMSGGIAYVLDEDESLNDLYNSQMVELETIIESKDDIKDEFLDNHLFNDSERLKKLITNHMHYTNSETAEKIVNDFSIYLKKFKKVMPIEYKRVLEKNLEKDKVEDNFEKIG